MQYGRIDDFDYALDAYYASQNGQRPNNDLDLTTLSLRLKQQMTDKDSFYLQTVYSDGTSGDLAQYYDPAQANPAVRTRERQEPILLGGYHREWSPGVHTLFLAGGLQDTYEVTNPDDVALLAGDHALDGRHHPRGTDRHAEPDEA